MSNYDDDRPNWREIDRNKDKSGFYGRQDKGEKKEGGVREGPKDRWQSGRVKEALDRLFMGKKGTIEHNKLYKKVHQSYGSGTFLRNVIKYIEQYGLPDDAPTLLLVFDTRDKDIILSTIDKLKEIYAKLPQPQKDDVLRKLSIVAMSDRSKEIRLKAEEILEELGQELL
jgi:hypothetical protein